MRFPRISDKSQKVARIVERDIYHPFLFWRLTNKKVDENGKKVRTKLRVIADEFRRYYKIPNVSTRQWAKAIKAQLNDEIVWHRLRDEKHGEGEGDMQFTTIAFSKAKELREMKEAHRYFNSIKE
tara:strand:+ start:311 stop:685 length:375 start_codon:yes stop_codon:yes gene_type:complete